MNRTLAINKDGAKAFLTRYQYDGAGMSTTDVAFYDGNSPEETRVVITQLLRLRGLDAIWGPTTTATIEGTLTETASQTTHVQLHFRPKGRWLFVPILMNVLFWGMRLATRLLPPQIHFETTGDSFTLLFVMVFLILPLVPLVFDVVTYFTIRGGLKEHESP